RSGKAPEAHCPSAPRRSKMANLPSGGTRTPPVTYSGRSPCMGRRKCQPRRYATPGQPSAAREHADKRRLRTRSARPQDGGHGRGSVFIGALGDARPRRLVGGEGQKYSFSGLRLRGDTVVATASAIDVAPLPVSIDLGSGVISELANPATVLEEEGTLTEVET